MCEYPRKCTTDVLPFTKKKINPKIIEIIRRKTRNNRLYFEITSIKGTPFKGVAETFSKIIRKVKSKFVD